MTQIGRNVRTLRLRRGIKQFELAELIEVSAPMISAVENGTRQPSYEVLIRLADVFDVTADDLLRGEVSLEAVA